jgi:hypothetical protein
MTVTGSDEDLGACRVASDDHHQIVERTRRVLKGQARVFPMQNTPHTFPRVFEQARACTAEPAPAGNAMDESRLEPS